MSDVVIKTFRFNSDDLNRVRRFQEKLQIHQESHALPGQRVQVTETDVIRFVLAEVAKSYGIE